MARADRPQPASRTAGCRDQPGSSEILPNLFSGRIVRLAGSVGGLDRPMPRALVTLRRFCCLFRFSERLTPAPAIRFEGLTNCFRDRVSDCVGLSEADLPLCRVNIYVNCFRVHFQEQKGHWVLTLHQRGMIALTQSVLDRNIFDGRPFTKRICSAFVDRLTPALPRKPEMVIPCAESG